MASTSAPSSALGRSVRWVVAGQVASQLLSLASLALLYRLVEPAAFGRFGMALPFVMLPRTLATLGLGAAAIQRHELSRDEQSLVFWMQTGIGLAFTALTWLLATPAAILYQEPAVGRLIRVLAGTVLIASLSATHQALLERELQLARVTVIRLIGQLLGVCAAMWAALNEWQSSALVVQQYGELTALLAASWLARPWWPRLSLSRQHAWRELATFGGYYSLGNLLLVLVHHVDKLLLGMWLGDSTAGQAIVGAYTQAYNLMMRPVYLVTAPLNGILLPALSRAQHDPTRFAMLVERAFRFTAVALFPASVGLALVGRDFLTWLGGPQWKDAGLLLCYLSLMIGVQGWMQLCVSVLASRGRSRMLAFAAFVVLLVSLQAVVAGYWVGRAQPHQPLAVAVVVAGFLAMTTLVIVGLPFVTTSLLSAGVSPQRILSTGLLPFHNALLMGFVVAALAYALPKETPLVVRLGSCIASGVVVYGLLSWRLLRQAVAEFKAS